MSYNQTELRKRVADLLRRPENKECADCTERLPKWAVVNHGIFVCLNCSGQHRNIGAHISKVKSATLDDWTPEEVAFMASMGNEKANAKFLANLPQGMSKPQSSDDRGRERWIKQKYVQRKWYGEPAQAAPQSVAQVQQAPTPVQQQNQQMQAQMRPQPQFATSMQPATVFPTSTTAVTNNNNQPSPVADLFGMLQTSSSQPVKQQTNPQLSFQGFQTSSPGYSPVSSQSTQQQRTFAAQGFTSPQRAQPVYQNTQPMIMQQQPQPQQQQTGMLIDFGTTTKQQPRPIDPNAANQLMSCFGGR